MIFFEVKIKYNLIEISIKKARKVVQELSRLALEIGTFLAIIKTIAESLK